MAKNGAYGHGRVGAVVGRTQTKNPATGRWSDRDTTTGQFASVKAAGGDFRGVVREGVDRDGPFWIGLVVMLVLAVVVLAVLV